jgi:hypothetical protein
VNLEFFTSLLRKRAPKLMMALQGLPPQTRIAKLDALEAEALLHDPPGPKPYPAEACRERDRLLALSRDRRHEAMRSREYDEPSLYRGRKEFAAWYTLVRKDLELLEQTLGGVGLDSSQGQKLARLIRSLADQYAIMPATWPRDREFPDGAPCTTPQYYQRRARKWTTPLRIVEPKQAKDDFFHREESRL